MNLLARTACLVLLAVSAWAGIGRAYAASPIGVCDYGQNCTRTQAFAAINDGAGFCKRWSSGATATYVTSPYLSGSNQYLAKIKCQPSNPNSSASIFELYTIFYSSCPPGQQWFESSGACGSSCGSRPTRGAVFAGSAGTCINECEYVVDISAAGSAVSSYEVGGKKFTSATAVSPTGNTCNASPDDVAPDQDACVQQGGLTQCIKRDGRHCAVASSGKEFCWDSGENGIKASGNDAATKAPIGKEAKPPPLPPNNGGEWEQKGQSTVIEKPKDGPDRESSVTGWQSSYGSQGQGSKGNSASGEGKGGSGSGSGLGNGSGDGDGEGDDDGEGNGPGAGADDFYSPSDKTVASVFDAFKARVTDSPLISAVESFFTVNASGGCPTFTIPATEYWQSMSYDAHCSGDFLAALQSIGWVLMACAALLAAYWALS